MADIEKVLKGLKKLRENSGCLLKEKTLFVMKQDIDEATERNALGWECDVKTWQEFRRWIVQEEERIEKGGEL